MRARTVAVTAALVGGLVAPSVAAPAKALCFQVKDDAGDARPLAQQTPPLLQADSLDVLSADIATGPKNLVATVRLESLTKEPYLLGGSLYLFNFTLGGQRQELYLKTTTSGTDSAVYSPDSSAASGVRVDFAKDVAAATVSWTVPRKTVVGLKGAAKISDLVVNAMAGTNVQEGSSGRGGTGFDKATGTSAYTDGQPTCLKGT